MTRSMSPAVARKTIVTMAGDHGVVAEGVSKYPQEVTPQMVLGSWPAWRASTPWRDWPAPGWSWSTWAWPADLSQLAESGKIIDKKVALGTANMAVGPAMTRAAGRASRRGRDRSGESLADATDVFGTGDMGIANTTPSTAVVAALTGQSVAELTGRGTGIDDGQLARKIAVVEKALKLNRPDASDALDVLAKVGGFEIGGIAGVVLAAAARRKPVVIDGFISTAGALVAHALCPAAGDYVIAAHRSAEQGPSSDARAIGQGAAAGPRPAIGRRDRRGTGHELGGSSPANSYRGGNVRRGPRVESRVMKQLLAALRFLTIVPIPGGWGTAEADLAGSVGWFPVVGLLLGGVAAAVAWGLSLAAPPLVGAAVVVIVLLSFSGCLHLDGLSDTADGFSSSRSRQRILEIMKDSHIGAMGVIAVVCVLMLKFAALASLPVARLWPAALLMPLAGRCALVLHMALLPCARPEGLGSIFYRRRPRWAAVWAVAVLGRRPTACWASRGSLVWALSSWWRLLFRPMSIARSAARRATPRAPSAKSSRSCRRLTLAVGHPVGTFWL